MKELTMEEMEEIQAGDGCSTATRIGAVMGTIALVGTIGALTVATGGTAWLAFTAAAITFGVPSTGLGIGTAIGCS